MKCGSISIETDAHGRTTAMHFAAGHYMARASDPFQSGEMVRMTKQHKNDNASDAHIIEFGSCVGVVIGPTDYGTCVGPEIDVRWLPSGLRYSYSSEDLERIVLVEEVKR
jgi:hypothetical protein